ncbi:oocyte zinc finger protein XlCOF7.1 isoform X2 [Bombina bombina]|nr:oocyte zinc finger protein XlCOF7.1 isoform X2 [Bombina bombina]
MMDKINKDTKKMSERILNNSLEIIYMLTGEEYTVVKKNSPHSSFHPLTGEVPIKCGDVAMHFSMEEWEYIEENKDLYENVIISNEEEENPQTLKTVESPAHSTSGSSDEVKADVELEAEQKDDLCVRSPQKPEELEICDNICTGEIKTIKTEVIIDTEQPEEPCMGNQLESHKQEVSHKIRTARLLGQKGIREIWETKDWKKSCKIKTEAGIDSEQTEKLCVGSQLEASEQDTCDRVSSGLENLYYVSVVEEEDDDDESDDKNVQKVKILSDTWTDTTDGYMTWNTFGEHIYPFSPDRAIPEVGVNQIYQGANHIEQNTPNSVIKSVKMMAMDSNPHEERNLWYNGSESAKGINSGSAIHSFITDQVIRTGEKSIICSECGKCFSNNSNLVAHKRIHTREKLFACPECGKQFNRNSSLTRHQKIHSGIKPFACSDCGKCFVHKVNLVTHKRTHTGERPFPCSDCGKCFSRSYILMRHKEKHHRHMTNPPPTLLNVVNVSAGGIFL